ncbi:sulfoxide reductase heme-binding subunit YedZ [Orrella sp. NBD-18]|uniref:Protein-methionine-sulfoxide reductase heme-binding subunit MsrQ n=1 Tax=Sheuella amnicola TaxID=2707330 RepID=A0A6B2QYM3_9BURK|nr:protein-methionine-sulfoxide reductase heme-binding subunit MsrQ [Sheuella amnicola]NDY83121.1 sulfoxide reductase heme-binding subunit YedZ [Sheuella amnicola]
MKSVSPQFIDRAKPVLFLLGVFPLFRWIWLGFEQQLTANPIEFLTRSSGTWTLVCLLVTLSISPLRQWLSQPLLLRWRRMCGLFTLFYGTLHMLTWAWWDQGFDFVAMFSDILKRPFILVGALAFLGLTLLGLTSTKGWMRRLGRHWQTLHRLVYLITLLAILHYYWHKSGKSDYSTVLIYAAVASFLLLWRIYRRLVPVVGNASKRPAV